MGGGVISKYACSDDHAMQADIIPEGTLFKPRRASIADLERSFSERWSFSGEEHFNIASLELLNALVQHEAGSDRDKLDVFDQWIEDKSLGCKISIHRGHVNAVSTSIKQQRALPDNFLSLLDRYLSGLPSDFDIIARINAVSDEHASDLSLSAEEQQNVHHDLPHALEIELRTMNMLQYLNIWQEDTPREAFLRASIACMIRLHDHEQKNKAPGSSNEEITAERVIAWLNIALNISDDETHATAEEIAVKHILQFMAHRIIVCGTTMIYSQKRTLDLIELLFVLEKTAEDQRFSLSLKSNQSLIERINITTILVGANDKNSGASLLNALMQLKQSNMNTLLLIKHYYHEISVLEAFFTSTKFKAYYDVDRLREYYYAGGFSVDYDERGFFEAVNKQAFLISIVPHVCMRPEFLKITDASRTQLRAFIQLCRSNLHRDSEVFKQEFEDAFDTYGVAEIVNHLFFAQISSEVGFSCSQEGGLIEMAEAGLPDMGVTRAEVVYSLIDSSVPSKDAINLQELKIFYDELTPENKVFLSKELMMVVVLQAGAMKALELGLADLSEEKSFYQAML